MHPGRANLIISPTFDSTITSDPHAAAIEGAINTAISSFESDIATNITVNITFKEMSSGLGETQFSLYSVPYSTFYSALHASETSSVDSLALANLPGGANNPVTGVPYIVMKSANIKALGITGSLTSPDATISFNTSITTQGSATGPYDLLPVAEHEIDEALGLGSTLGLNLSSPYNNYPSPEDLFRYDGSGNRSFTLADTPAFFSLDGVTQLAQFNTTGSGDYGDWGSTTGETSSPAKVQDAAATPGSHPALGVELTALDAIGYNLATPEPATFALIGGALLLIAAKLRRRA